LTHSAQRRTALIMFLALAYALGPFTIDPFTASFPSIGSTFGVNTALLQYSMTGVTVGMGLGQLVAGPFADSVGRKIPMTVAIGLYVLGAFASAAAPNIWVFIAMRTVMAIGSSGAAVIAAAIVRDSATGDAMLKMLSRIFWVQGISPLAAPILGAQLIQVVDWRTIFQIFGGVAALALIWSLRLKETLDPAKRNGSVFGGMGKRFGYVLKDRSYQGLLVIGVITTVQLYAYLNLFPFLFLNLLHVDKSTYGLLAGSVSLSWLIGFQFSAAIAPRWGYLRTLGLAMIFGIAAGIGGLTIGTSNVTQPIFMVMVYLAILAFGMSGGPLQTLALAPHGDEAGTAAALLGTLSFLVTSLISPLFTMLPTDSMSGLSSVVLASYLAGLAAIWFVIHPALRHSQLR